MYIVMPMHHAKLIHTDPSIYPRVQNLYHLALFIVLQHASITPLENFFVLASQDVEDGLCVAEADESEEGLVEVLE